MLTVRRYPVVRASTNDGCISCRHGSLPVIEEESVINGNGLDIRDWVGDTDPATRRRSSGVEALPGPACCEPARWCRALTSIGIERIR